ncbi:MAG: DEAD/DEAH box helicase [Cytophagaceae bacterium]|jgi:ATP-dependent RNA helicase DeaD|nr:DEAD/DEAH box helicase [Cytophagaceae bacterium]
MLFSELGLSEALMQAIELTGYTEATPIQAQAIPVILSGADVTGQAQTGTGKTAAFGIPAIEQINPDKKGVQTLILCPTRELALQVSVELKKLAKFKKGVFVSTIYGGESMERQIKDLQKGVQIVVGTPGRVIDHMDRGTLKMNSIQQIILDEADEMLNMGFREDIELVLDRMPEERQIVLFSATMPQAILQLTKRYQKNPQFVKIQNKEVTTNTIEQYYYMVKESMKMEIMTQVMDMNNLQLMLVFCNTKRKVDEVTEELRSYGYKAVGLHGDKSQKDRNDVMNKFRKGFATILVATDVAARGIDVSGVDAVINYDVPLDIENYVHRIGRTGRAGKLGKSFTLVTGEDRYKMRDIESYTKAEIKRTTTPTKAELLEYKKGKLAQRIENSVNDEGNEHWVNLLEELESKGLDVRTIAVSVLRQTFPELMDLLKPEPAPKERTRDRRDDGERRSGDRYERNSERGGDRFERGSRPQGRSREGGARRFSSDNMTRLFFNLGKKDKVNPGDIVGAITGESKIKGSQIGQIDIFDKYSFVEVPNDVVDKVMEGMKNNKIKGKTVNIELASSR